jgi:hypothetical protein
MEEGKVFEAEEFREAHNVPEASSMTRDAVPQEATDRTDTSLGKDLPSTPDVVGPSKRRLSNGEGASFEVRRSEQWAKKAGT